METETIVVKIGSSSLINNDGTICEKKILDHVESIAFLRNKGYDIILVSSGAVASGLSFLNPCINSTQNTIKSAAAAIGQSILTKTYYEMFDKFNIKIGQILINDFNLNNAKKSDFINSIIKRLLKSGIIPIINYNDALVTKDEFIDNDMLSALICSIVKASFLIILTDINGVYNENPIISKKARKYKYINEITDKLIQSSSDSLSRIGTGGMKSKLIAARTALSFNTNVFIGKENGKEKLLNIIKGKGDGTYIGAFNLVEQI